MKEATGELGTTVLVIIAIVAVIAILALLAPQMTKWVNGSFYNMTTGKAKTSINIGNGG